MTLAGPTRPAYLLYHLLWSCLDWIFPPACGGCGKPGTRWCAECRQTIEKVAEPVCQICGDPGQNEDLCPDCRASRPEYIKLRSAAMFAGPLRAALHRLKYERDAGLGEPLSKHLIELYNQDKWDIDLVVPTPLSARRARERGYNQSSMLARPFAWAIQKPYHPAALRRTRETRSQVGLSAAERRKNVESSFTALPETVRGKTVLIIDDVMTTGSTINACAQALRTAGATGVYGLTLARAALHTHTDDRRNPSDPKWR